MGHSALSHFGPGSFGKTRNVTIHAKLICMRLVEESAYVQSYLLHYWPRRHIR